MLTLPAKDIVTKVDNPKLSFILPKVDSKDGKGGNREMRFGSDPNTFIFRNIISYACKYKIYATQV